MKEINQRYQVLEEIRRGRVFDKFIAYDKIAKKLVLLKSCSLPYGKNTRLGEILLRNFKSFSNLNHPNLLRILEFGFDEQVFFVVEEYFVGEYLDRYIDRSNLDLRKCLKISVQVAQALKYLEENFLYHGNLQPPSILISEYDDVKIDDIGLNFLVIPSLGNLSIQDDIYNLGSILYDLITSISRKDKLAHSKSLERILYKIRHKDLSQRYQHTEEILNDLKLCYDEIEIEKRVDVKTAEIQKQREFEFKKLERPRKRKKKAIGILFFPLMALFLISLFGLSFYYLLFPLKEVKVPDIVKKDINSAREILRKYNLRIVIQNSRFDNEIPKDSIIRQAPYAGKKVKEGKVVYVVISKGPELIEVPNLQGMTLYQAEISLENLRLKLGKVTRVADENIAKDTVIEQVQSPQSLIKVGGNIDVKASSGPSKLIVEVPNFIGQNIDDVKLKLEQLGLTIGEIKRVQSDAPENTVTDQRPPAGARRDEGTPINLTISSKEERVKKERKQAEIQIQVPESEREKLVKVVVIDEQGARTPYKRSHKPGDRIKLDIKGTGKTTVQVYIDGKIIEEETF